MTDQIYDRILRYSRNALRCAPPVGASEYAAYCAALREHLDRRWSSVVEANATDVAAMRARTMPAGLVDRVRLGAEHRELFGRLVDNVAVAIRDPLLGRDTGPPRSVGSLQVRRIVKPLGVVFMIYEARPAVTVEGALLPVVMGNAVILRGGREIAATNRMLASIVADSLRAAGLPGHLVQVLDDTDRAQLRAMLRRHDAIDVVIPRGGPSLVDYCRTSSTIPVIASGGGVNHLYVHRDAPVDRTAELVLDSKLPEPTACNTVETVLCDVEIHLRLLESIVRTATLTGQPCTLRVPSGTAVTGTDLVRIESIEEHDSGREFLDRTIALRPVSGVEEATEYIHRYGSGHTEAVVAEDVEVIDTFCRRVDAATIVVNGSLRLHDGPTMRIGPEISISTDRLHVRGPVGLAALATYSWVVTGQHTLRGRSTVSGGV